MELKITIDKPDWSAVNHGKKVVMVEFPNAISTTNNKSFKWVPTYKQLIDLKAELDKAEIQWQELKIHNITYKGGNQ